MDEIVLRSMAKWPKVPAVYDWLSLDRRGNWLIKGERIANTRIVEFINRNYDIDSAGNGFFQNGPQRVYVALEYTPWIYLLPLRREPAGGRERLLTHTGREVADLQDVYLDETGSLLLRSEHGVGQMDDRDLPALLPHFRDAAGQPLVEDLLLEALDATFPGSLGRLRFLWNGRLLPIRRIEAKAVPRIFKFCPSPAAPS